MPAPASCGGSNHCHEHSRQRRNARRSSPAVEPPREVRLHFHGATAEDAAAIAARVNRDRS